MATRTTCLRQEPRASLANPATMIVVAMITAMTFSASGAAPTPLYHLYQEHLGLTPALVTVIFAAYVLCLLLALLTTGALSDYVGYSGHFTASGLRRWISSPPAVFNPVSLPASYPHTLIGIM